LLAGVRDRCATLARISAERAALAVELATADDSPERNLARALTAIRTSMFHCETLCAQGIIDRKSHDYLRHRVDQVIAGLKSLQATESDHWLDLPVIPLEAEAAEHGETVAPTLLHIILERVEQAVRLILPRQVPPSETAASGGRKDSR
jgi:hypothetical protein